MDGLQVCRTTELMDVPKEASHYERASIDDYTFYYNGYIESTVANVYTHYNEATFYTPSTKSTQQNRESKTEKWHPRPHPMQNGAGKPKRLEGKSNHLTFGLKNGQQRQLWPQYKRLKPI